jgi:hydroxyacylglutathione hydrolase
MNFYEVHPVNDHIFVIAERYSPELVVTMQLVVGEKKAALIDTGTGIGDLKSVVDSLTSLPVMVLNTHVHIDHVGGNSFFEECYLNQRDEALLSWAMSTKERLAFIQDWSQTPEWYHSAEKSISRVETCSYQFIDEGDIVDLGGIHIRPIALPGHTQGSLMYMIEEDQILLSGDSINTSPFLFLPESSSVEGYLKQLRAALPKFADAKQIYCGHGCTDIGLDVPQRLQQCCEAVIAGVEGEMTHTCVGEALSYFDYGVRVYFDINKIKEA